jgi:hypothetical protein
MLKTSLALLLPLLLLSDNGPGPRVDRVAQTVPASDTGTLEKMIVASGSATLDIDLNRLNGIQSPARAASLRFALAPDSFFTILVFNGELRGPLPSSVELVSKGPGPLPAPLGALHDHLMVENTSWGGPSELVVRDGKTGTGVFNVEGHQYGYDAETHLLDLRAGRLLVSKELALELGRPSEAGSVVGEIAMAATMRAIEITKLVNGEVESDVLPAHPGVGTVPGPDVIVGDLSGLAQFGSSSGTQVGLAVGTDSCNAGTVDLDWFALPNNDHPVIPQNLYRMSGGATNDERFEQVGQSNVKHAFTALTLNLCGFGCNGVGGTHLGSGCSDPYSASLNSGPNLGSRAWINAFTGFFPLGNSPTPPNDHTGHVHLGPSHRILVEVDDLNTTLNPGATYWAEGQYVTPHEYAWCQGHPAECNMYNNVSYRRYSVSGTSSPFSFTPVAATVRMSPAIMAWTGATVTQIEPDPANDGIGAVGFKVTNPSPGVWHYEYAIYNENIDRGIQSFTVPLGPGVTITNIGFHAPPQHPGWTADGTVGNTGYSSTPWTQTQTATELTWSSETMAQNPNANAIRWGTLYNFRFDADVAPGTGNATIAFFKTGAPITVPAPGPGATPVELMGFSVE